MAKLTATFKDGTVITRTTDRTYAVAYLVKANGKCVRSGFAASAALASKAVSMFANPKGKFGTMFNGEFVPFTKCVMEIEIVAVQSK